MPVHECECKRPFANSGRGPGGGCDPLAIPDKSTELDIWNWNLADPLQVALQVVQDLEGVLLVKHTDSSQLCWIDPFSESVWVKGGPQLGRSTS